MSILWCGSEDVDFPNGGVAISTVTTTTYFRSTYSRASIAAASGHAYSNAFIGGAVTNLWFSFQLGFNAGNSNGSVTWGRLCAGVGNTSLTNGTGIFIYTSTSPTTALAIVKFDGTTVTQLAAGNGGIVNGSIQVTRCDLQIINYGASATLNLYVNGTLHCSYSGNALVGSLTNFNCVNLWTTPSGSFGASACGSEFIVADEDTRSMNLRTLAPAALGTTTQWAGAVTNANPVIIADANYVTTNVATQDEQFTTSGLPTGTWGPRLVKTTSRGASTAGATATKWTPGFNLGGTVSVVGGTTHTPGTSFTNFEDFWTTNPVSGVAWTAADLAAANFQIDLRSS
jgi:hypothetical protein